MLNGDSAQSPVARHCASTEAGTAGMSVLGPRARGIRQGKPDMARLSLEVPDPACWIECEVGVWGRAGTALLHWSTWYRCDYFGYLF